MYSMNDISTRRAVVYQILKEVLSPNECMEALWILENNYLQQTVVPILEYVDCIEQDIADLGKNKLYLSRELTKQLYGPCNDAYADPWDEMQAFKSVTSNLTETDSDIDNSLDSSGT